VPFRVTHAAMKSRTPLLPIALVFGPALGLVIASDVGAQPKKEPAPAASAKPGPKAAAPALPEKPEKEKKILGKPGPAPKPEDQWVGATADDTIATLERRATKEGLAGQAMAIGPILAIPALADSAKAGAARAALERISKALLAGKTKESRDLGREAWLLARGISPDVGLPSAKVEEAKLGLVPAWRVVGPFKDTGGTGLDRAEGPEVPAPASFLEEKGEGGKKEPKKDPKKDKKPEPKKDGKAKPELPKATNVSLALWKQADARWDDGAYDVAFRAVPSDLVSARGVPLELLVYPRKEACTYVASAVTLDVDAKVVLHVASAGAVRVLWDGFSVAKDDEQHPGSDGTRLSVRVDAQKGTHLFALKICAGPNADDGRFLARVTDEEGNPIGKVTDDLASLPGNGAAPKAVAVVPSPLAKALAVVTDKVSEPTPDKAPTALEERLVDEALAAAMARKLGGAEDSRSPKTQGLLDLVVTHNPRPDILSWAAVLSPSRANLTGWLGLAIKGAEAEPAAYEAVGKDARRTLFTARLSAGYVDWAAASMAGSELQKATDLDARILRARLAQALGQEEPAFQQWKGIWDQLGKDTPTYVLRAIAGFNRVPSSGQARKQALDVWPNESPIAFASSRRTLGSAEVKAAVKSTFRLFSGTGDLDGAANLLKSVGLLEEHKRMLLLSTAWAPNHKATWESLTQALAASTDPKEKELAKQALARARDLDPGNPFLRAEENLAFGPNHPDDEQFMPEPATFLARRKGAPKPNPDGSQPPLDVYDRELDWLRVVTVDDAGRVAQLIHYTREIVKAPKDSSDLDEPHVPAEGDIVEVVRARVHHPDGTVAVPQQIDEGGNIGIRWTDLKPGDVVEVATRGYTELPIGDRAAPPFYFFDYAGGPSTHPVLWNEIIVRAPKKHPLYTAVVNTPLSDVHDVSTDKLGRKVERYVWKNPITYPEEPLQPRGTELFPTLIGSQFQTWDDFVTWYKAGIESFASVDPRVKRKAEEITKKAKSKEEKITLIFNWIADQVKYVNYVSAEQWLPNRPQNVLDRMQGDCDDKAMLLITMLKAVGINEAQEVLVQTRYTGMPSVITAKGAVAPLFDHGIAFLPKDGKTLERYLDATSPESRIGPLPAMDARAVAIRIVPGGTTPVVILPAGVPDDHGVDGAWTFTLGPDGSAQVSIKETHGGDSAFWLRSSLKQAASAATWLEKNHAVASLPQIEVLPAVKFDGELPLGRAKLELSAKSSALARREGTDLVVAAGSGSLKQSLAPLIERKTPVVLPHQMAPSKQSYEITLVPPPGWTAGELPPGDVVDGGAFGKATLTLKKGPKGAVILQRTVVLDQSFIKVDEYQKWRAFLTKVDLLLHREIRFVKGGS